MRILAFILLFFSSVSVLLAQPSGNALREFELGTESYREGNYESALEHFQKAAEQAGGFALEYNLANSFFKLNQIPECILHYERALKYEPSNEDALYNLQLANDLIVDRIETLPRSKLNRWWRSFRFGMGPSAWTWLSIVFSLGCAALFFLFYVSNGIGWKRFGFFGGVIFLIATGLTYGLAQSAYAFRTASKSAIVFADKVDVKSEPRDQAIQVFVLHTGSKVSLLGEEGEWVEIEIASGSRGWMLRTDLNEI